MKQAPVKVGLVGIGKMGQNHLRVLSMLKDVELAFIHDSNREAVARMGAAYGVPGADDLDKALAGVDAAVICTPTSTHAQYVRQVARHVRNILIEKPLAQTLAESRELAELERRDGLSLQVGFIERFNPAVQQMKAVLEKSRKVVSIDFTRTNRLSSRITDVDVVTDLMIHDIDLALHMNGPVSDVSAHGALEGNMIDYAAALLTHRNGRFSRIQASRITEKKMRTIQATCTDMFVHCELVRKEIVINRQSEIRQAPGEPYTISAIEETVEVRPQEALLSELQAFVALCRGKREASVPTGQDGLDAAVICEDIRRAILQ